MPINQLKKAVVTSWTQSLTTLAVVLLICGHSPAPPQDVGSGNCDPRQLNFHGYTFIVPEIINKNAAFAPYLVRWEDYYDRFYFNRDIQKEDNVVEWIERFCKQPTPEDVVDVVYNASYNDLSGLKDRILDPDEKAPIPYPFGGNTFAENLVVSRCEEIIDYLLFTRKCEPYVVAGQYSYAPEVRDKAAMEVLIEEGLDRFNRTYSHFVKMRYAYQIIRLTHYAGKWERTVELYDYLIPKIDRRKYSILSHWILGHVAGALQKMGKYPEAAYRYARIFKDSPSKRTTAFRSFYLRNDADWEAAYQLCRNKEERATMYLLRAGQSKTFTVKDIAEAYAVDPNNPQLELLLISFIQDLEKVLLATSVTETKYGYNIPKSRRTLAAKQVISLQNLVRDVIEDGKCPNLILWRACRGYLQLLAGDTYAAGKTFDRVSDDLKWGNSYHRELERQIAIWRILLEIIEIDPDNAFADQAGYRVRSYKQFQDFPYFEPFLKDWLSAAYAASGQPGKALLSAYPTEALTYNPRVDVIDDLLKAADEENPIFMEKAMQMDTNPDRLLAYLREIKGAALLAKGQPEAAITVMQEITEVEQLNMEKFSPFREIIHERIHRPITDSLFLNRLQVAEQLMQFEFQARSDEALGLPSAARNYYLIGLGYYNMSFFGYEYEVTDYHREGGNWARLAQGPVFPLKGSPDGNRENLDLSLALSYFEKALSTTRDPEMAARAAFMAARCQQKQWFTSKSCTYRPGSKQIPVIPENYSGYYSLIKRKYKSTKFYENAIKECKWLEVYAR